MFFFLQFTAEEVNVGDKVLFQEQDTSITSRKNHRNKGFLVF